MKKSVISFILILTILCSLPLSLGAYAAEADDQESSQPTEEASQPMETEPTEPQYESVQVGSNMGLDAPGALAGPNEKDFEAASILLYEMNSDTMVYAKNIDGMRYPASLTKVMTCLLALEMGNLEDTVTVSKAAISGLHPNGSSSGLIAGEMLSLEQLLYCLMIQSANDAAPVIAEHIAGSELAFVALMNKKATELGCTNTHFANTHGLHNDNHYTTARDMAKIMSAALEHKKFLEIYSTPRYELPPTNLHDKRVMLTTNYLVDTSVTATYYDKRVVGGKTGFTTPAGRCVMFTAEEGNLRYLCVVMGADNIVTEETTIYGSFQVASKVLDLGFNYYTFAEILSPYAPEIQVPVSGAAEDAVLVPIETVTALLPDNYDPRLLSTKYFSDEPGGLEAPIPAGKQVGWARKYYGNVCIGEVRVATANPVNKVTLVDVTAGIPQQELPVSSWKTPVTVLAILFLFLLILFIISARQRYLRRKARRERRKQVR